MIESKQNNSFKTWMKLKSKKYRDEYGLFLVFGDDLIDKARENDQIVEIVSVNEGEGTRISKELLKLLQPDTNFDTMAICKKINKNTISNRVLILDDIQDPSNLGALIRSASAFDFSKIIVSNHSADIYHEKTVRTSKGAIFDCEIKRLDIISEIDKLKKEGFIIIGSDAHGNTDILDIKKENSKIALVLGNEGNGIKESIMSLCDYVWTIKTNNVESLNVAAAGAILMYIWRNE